MHRTVVNAQTGEVKLVNLTAQEISDAQERSAAESIKDVPLEVTAGKIFDALKAKGILNEADLK